MALAQAIILGNATEVLVSHDDAVYEVASIILCNVTSDPETVTIFAAPSGVELGAGCTVVDDLVIDPHSTHHFEFPLILEAGDRLVAQASFGGRATITAAYRNLPRT